MPNMKISPMTIRATRRKSRRFASDMFTSPNGGSLPDGCASRQRPRDSSAAECSQQFPPSDGDCHTPLPREVRQGNDTTPRASSLAVQGGQNACSSTSVVGFKFGSGDAADNSAVVVPFAGPGEGGRAFEDHRRRTIFYHASHSNAARKLDERARWSVVVSHLLRKSVCFAMCAGSAYWCHLSAKSCAISTNGHNPF